MSGQLLHLNTFGRGFRAPVLSDSIFHNGRNKPFYPSEWLGEYLDSLFLSKTLQEELMVHYQYLLACAYRSTGSIEWSDW